MSFIKVVIFWEVCAVHIIGYWRVLAAPILMRIFALDSSFHSAQIICDIASYSDKKRGN